VGYVTVFVKFTPPRIQMDLPVRKLFLAQVGKDTLIIIF
jgi:hypothetical protein